MRTSMASLATTSFSILIMAMLVFTCGKSEDDDEEEDTINENITSPGDLPRGIGTLAAGDEGLSQLPNVTDPVFLDTENQSSEAEDFDSGSGTLEIDFELLASGIALDESTTKNDFQDKSYSACRMVNRARGFFHMAAAGDVVNCELKYFIGESDDFYDDKYHIVRFVEDDETETYRFRIHGTKENVTGLTFQICEGGTQHLYLNKTIENGVATIVSKRYSEPGNPQVDTFRGVTTVTGGVDDSGEFSDLKTIVTYYSNSFSNDTSNTVKEKTIQSEDNILYAAYMEDSPRDGGSDPHVSKFVSFLNLIDNNTEAEPFSLQNLELGDGAMTAKQSDDPVVTQGWKASDRSIDNSNSYMDRVSAYATDLPTKPDSIPTLAFEGDEILDCDAEAEFTIDYEDYEDLIADNLELQDDDDDDDDDLCRDRYELPQDDYIECHEVADQTGI